MTDLVIISILAYLELSVLLALGFVVYRVVRWASERNATRLDASSVIRTARTVFVGALLAPIFVHGLFTLLPWNTASHGGAEVAGGASSGSVENLIGGFFGSRALEATTGALFSIFKDVAQWKIDLAAALLAATVLTGIVIVASRLASKLLDLGALIRQAVPLRRVGRVRVVVSDRTAVPFSTVVLAKAHVVLPVGILENAELLRVALRHELEHHRRSDPAWAVLVELVNVLFFWNPAVRALRSDLLELQELACDEAVVRLGVPATLYASCLVRVAEMAVDRRVVASTSMASSSAEQMRNRLDRLSRLGARQSRLLTGLFATASLAILLTAAYATASTVSSLGDASHRDAGTEAAESATNSHDGDTIDGRDCEGCDEDIVDVFAAQSPLERLGPWEGAPEFVFQTEGGSVSLSSLRGKVVMIDVWASWCRFCADEIPLLHAIDERFTGSDFQLVGISISKNRGEFEAFVAKHEIDWPQLHDESEFDGEAARLLGVDATPSHYLVDRQGYFVRVPLGNSETLIEVIEELIDGGKIATR